MCSQSNKRNTNNGSGWNEGDSRLCRRCDSFGKLQIQSDTNHNEIFGSRRDNWPRSRSRKNKIHVYLYHEIIRNNSDLPADAYYLKKKCIIVQIFRGKYKNENNVHDEIRRNE